MNSGDYREGLIRLGGFEFLLDWHKNLQCIEVTPRTKGEGGWRKMVMKIIYVPCQPCHMDYLLLTMLSITRVFVTRHIAALYYLNFGPSAVYYVKPEPCFLPV